MLYNVYINGNVAIKVTDYNKECTPCNQMGSVPSQEVRVMNINLPAGQVVRGDRHEAIKKYINLNHIL